MTENQPKRSRILGRYSQQSPGPTLLVCAGLHGNEPAGVEAAAAVCRVLAQNNAPLRGELICVAGNLAALADKKRYIAEDLNRMWTPEQIAASRVRDPSSDSVEQREQREILAVIDGIEGRRFALDLHTTSGSTAPFALMADTLANQRFARQIPVPVVMGLEESVNGTLLSHLSDLGFDALVVESGQHTAAVADDHHQAVIWIALVAAGLLRAEDVPALGGLRRQLRASTAGLPAVVELRYIHPVGEGFKLPDGWVGFREIKKGEVLATEGGKSIPALLDGRILMPRYQSLGTDGFFVVQAVRPWKLMLGRALRRMHLDLLLPWVWLGVSREPGPTRGLRVRTHRIGRVLRAALRAFGYRRRHKDGDDTVCFQRKG